MICEQRKINLDNEFKTCWLIRKKIPERVTNIDFLIKKIKQINDNDDINKFLIFVEDLASEKYKRQRNNHNYMKTFLDEKVNDYVRIQYHLLQEALEKGKLSYAANLAPKRIMSNYFLSNLTEELLDVETLETAFRKFTRSERVFLTPEEKLIKIKATDETGFSQQFTIKINDEQIYDGEIQDIKKYFALQLTRREYFLCDILKKCLFNGKPFESLDLLDYLYCKYIYNEALLENYKNWLSIIGDKVEIYQTEYKKCLLNINYKEALILEKNLTRKDYTDSKLAISEAHTFYLFEILEPLELTSLNNCLEVNGLQIMTQEEINISKKILLTVGSKDKLCFLFTGGVSPSNDFFKKISFVIHNFWDEAMIYTTLLNLLLKKDSERNNVEHFKKAGITDDKFIQAKFMYSALRFSENFENKIKRKT